MNSKLKKILLIVGLIIFISSILIPFESPAKSYELSIYASTPITYWIGIGTVIFLSLIVSFNSNKEELPVSLFLAGMAIISIISLPIIRNYYYFGAADSITHLGLANEIMNNKVDVAGIFYPAIHIIGIFISSLTGLSLRISMMLNIPIFAGIFILFIPIVLKYIHGKYDSNLMIIGTFSAFLFLPINDIGLHFQTHPSSQAVLFFPALIYIFLKYEGEKSNNFLMLYILLFLGFLFIHPQQSLSFILLMTAIIIWRRVNKDNSFSINLLILSISILWIWISYNATFEKSLKILENLLIGDLNIASGVTQRGMSLLLIGGSLFELFIKIFLVASLFGIFTLSYIYTSIKIKKDFIKYLTIGMIPIALTSLTYLVIVPNPDQAFRYLGIIFMLLTITGAYSIFHFTEKIKSKRKAIFITIFFTIVLLLSVHIYFDSPWIYTGNPQVTESDYHGYATTFSIINSSFTFSSIRLSSDRYFATIQDLNWTSELRKNFRTSPDHFNNQSLSTFYNHSTYLAITKSEFIIDTELYQGFRFSNTDFEYLMSDVRLNKIQSNGGYNLFIINSK